MGKGVGERGKDAGREGERERKGEVDSERERGGGEGMREQPKEDEEDGEG